MVVLPDGTEVPNIPPPSPDDSSESGSSDYSSDEYENLNFTLGLNLGGATNYDTWRLLPTNRVVLPLVSRRPLRYSTHTFHAAGVFSFAQLAQ